MSSLSVLYERPISKAYVAEGERIRLRYEREIGRSRPKRGSQAKYYALMLEAEAKKPVPPPRRVVRLGILNSAESLVHRCQCGCGGILPNYRNAVFLPGHRVITGVRRMSDEQLEQQLGRIPDTELGRLAKKVLLRELGQ